VGFLLGRLANFVNGELWGNVSNVAWAVIFPRSAPGMSFEMIAPRHPSQLYEAATEGLILLLYMNWRFWKTDAQKHPGRLSAEFLLVYSASRIVCEQFREPDASLIFGMSRGIFYTFFLIALAAYFMVQSYRRPAIQIPYAANPDSAQPEKKKAPKKR
jgi:phosphatidylglycerol:prolipoprotein diacylglycerol transferase